VSKQAEDFRKINDVLIGVINVALTYLIHHDPCFKRYCLQTAAWDGIKKLEKIAVSLSEPFLSPAVRVCLAKCARARERMPEINVSYEQEFPVAASSLTRLAKQLDEIRKSVPSLSEGIDEDSLVSERMFTNLAKAVAKF
jgi:hypothetical protein